MHKEVDVTHLTGFNDSDSLLYTVAIDRENGEILWKDSVTPLYYFYIRPVNSYASPTVASDGKKVFACFPNYGFIAYDLNGTRRWDVKHNETFGKEFGAISPVVLDSIIIMNINCQGDPRILALSCQTGDTIWMVGHPEHQSASKSGTATPVIWNDIIIIHRGNEILALNLADGQPQWWLNTSTKGHATPVIQDDLLFVNTWNNAGEESLRGKQISFAELVRDYDQNSNLKIEQDEFEEDMVLFHRPESPDAPESAFALNDDRIFAWFDGNRDGSFEESE